MIWKKWKTIALWAVAIFYLVWGVDFVPDLIPIIGRIDDAAILLSRFAIQLKYRT